MDDNSNKHPDEEFIVTTKTEAGLSDTALAELAVRAGRALQNHGHTLITAESCTGGGIMKVMTDIPGSSDWCEGGFITYTNRAKASMLGVAETTLRQYGAVSQAAVEAMALGALAGSQATVALAVSGIAGPGGGSKEKPVGTVWLAWAERGREICAECCLFHGDRDRVRRQTIRYGLSQILARYPLPEA